MVSYRILHKLNMSVFHDCGHKQRGLWCAINIEKFHRKMSCIHRACFYFFVCIVQAVHLIAMYSLVTPHPSAVGVCLTLESMSVSMLAQGTHMDYQEQRGSIPVSLEFYRMAKMVWDSVYYLMTKVINTPVDSHHRTLKYRLIIVFVCQETYSSIHLASGIASKRLVRPT